MDKLQVPKNLNLPELDRYVPSQEVKGFHHDKVSFVCQSIYRGMELLDENYIHPEKTRKYFVPLNSTVLGRVLGRNNYKGILDWMEKALIIKADGSWKDGRVSQGYRFTDKYLFSEMIWKTVKSWQIQKKDLADCFDDKLHFQNAVVKGLKKWFSSKALTIDSTAANKLVKEIEADGLSHAGGKASAIKKVRLTANGHRRSITNIKNCTFLFKQDFFGYRLHTSITQLPKDFRHLIRYNGMPLVEVDISCSQLFFANFLMTSLHWMTPKNKTRNENLSKIWNKVSMRDSKYNTEYTNSIMCLKSFENSHSKGVSESYFQKKSRTGKLYESILEKLDSQHFLDKYPTYEDKRQHVKDILLQQLYADPRKAKHKGLYIGENLLVWQCFSILYPNEAKVFKLAKIANYKDLCMLLQRIEATAILAYVCKRLIKEYPEIPVFTLHDCLITTAGNEGVIKQVMNDEITRFMGIAPETKTKSWSSHWRQ